MKGWERISSRDSLLEGSRTRTFEIRFLAFWDTVISSLKVNWHYLILLYVFLTSEVSKGGRPYKRVYLDKKKQT